MQDEWLADIGTWFGVRRGKGNRFYAARDQWKNGRKTRLYLHRVIMSPRPGSVVDHISGDGLDNRRRNLRVCSQAQNSANRRAAIYGTSAYRGVFWREDAGKWAASISVAGRSYHLGFFETEEEAARAWDIEALKHRGEYAVLNLCS